MAVGSPGNTEFVYPYLIPAQNPAWPLCSPPLRSQVMDVDPALE